MRIFFDHQAFSLQNYGGISRYFCELITGINAGSVDKAHLSLFWSNNVHLEEYNLPILTYPFKDKYSRLLHKPNQFYNYVDYKINNYDIYHATYFDDFLSSKIGTKPFITTFYDMIYERLSQQFAELAVNKTIIPQKKEIAQQASHLIAISESTKQDMVDLLGVAPEKITVIYLGSSFTPRLKNLVNDSPKISQPYILYVGRRYDYKNFIPFLRAVSPLLIKHKVKLICAGGDEFTSTERNVMQSLTVSNYVEYRAINDAILQDLYENAIAFVFPSLYEGFGIPILEAFACKCPCVISDATSFPEVAGDAAMYFDPTKEESIRNAVESVILSESLRNKLIELGEQRLAHFSWQRTVKETLELYNKLV